jgi:hypothetical protein
MCPFIDGSNGREVHEMRGTRLVSQSYTTTIPLYSRQLPLFRGGVASCEQLTGGR